MEGSDHVAQVATHLTRLGFSADDAHRLASEKYRDLSNLVITIPKDPGMVAEEILRRELEDADQAADELG